MSMGAKLSGTAEGVLTDVSVEEACNGKFAVFFAHPEAFDSKKGQEVLRRMADNGMIMSVMLDEVHQGLEGHWNVIRPGMLRKV